MTAAGTAEHVVVIHRWPASAALYEGYLDHLALDVSYIVPAAMAGSVPASAAGVERVDRIDDLLALADAAGRLRRRVGPPTRIVALAAADLDAAAHLRQLLGCPGETPPNRATLSDRHAMLTAVAAAGVRVPPFEVVSQGSDVHRLLAEQAGPLVLSPRFGSAESPEILIETPDDAERLGGLLAEPMLARAAAESHAESYAVDGVWDGSRLLAWRASRYLNVGQAGWLGAVELAEPDGAMPPDRLAEFAATALGVLVARPAAVHVTMTAIGPGPELCFGWASTGFLGSELPLIWREVHGIDLAGAAIAGQLSRPLPRLSALRSLAADEPERSGRLGGWLRILPPVPPPCRVEAVSFTPGEPAPYAVELPDVGDLIAAGERAVASLRFRADSTAELERAVRAAADGIRLRCVPLR